MSYKLYDLKSVLEDAQASIEDAIDYVDDFEDLEEQVEDLEEKVDDLEEQVSDLEEQVEHLEAHSKYLEEVNEEQHEELINLRDASNLQDIIKWWMNELDNDSKYKVWELAYHLLLEKQETKELIFEQVEE